MYPIIRLRKASATTSRCEFLHVLNVKLVLPRLGSIRRGARAPWAPSPTFDWSWIAFPGVALAASPAELGAFVYVVFRKTRSAPCGSDSLQFFDVPPSRIESACWTPAARFDVVRTLMPLMSDSALPQQRSACIDMYVGKTLAPAFCGALMHVFDGWALR